LRGERRMLPSLISIIDDDESMRLALACLIRSFGFKVNSYESAEQFLAGAATESSCCIISDIHMPGLSGIDLKRQLDHASNAPPVILITARSEAWLLAEARASGAVCLLRKPFAAATLLECLRKARVI
jgi:FixJ family two-component response regulator